MADLIGDVLNNTLDKLGLAKKVKEKRVLDLWSEITGSEINRHTEAKYINQGILFVTVDNSVWAHQLLFMKQELIKKLNRRVEDELVKDIRFQSGNISSTQENEESNLDYKTIELDSKDMQEVEEASDLISDQDLKNKFYNLLITDKKVRKWKVENQWNLCSECSTLVPPKLEKCSICESKEKKLDVNKLEGILSNIPWMDYKEIIKVYPSLLEEEFEMIKDKLTQKLKIKIDKLIAEALKDNVNNQEVKVLIQNYVMLKTGISPENLTNRLIRQVIGDNYMKVYRQL